MKPVRLAIIGGGHLGYIHTKLARDNPGFRVVAVCDPQPLVQQRIIQEFDLRAISSWSKIIGEFDAAVIATPTVTHHEVATELIRHGVHLLIEKPLAATPAEATEICQLAAEHRVTVQVGHVENFNPVFQQVDSMTGKPFLVRASRHSGYTFRSTDISVVHDLMIHDIDLAAELLGGEVVDIQASGTTLFGPHVDIAEARITFSSGGVANLSASRCNRSPCRTMEISGPDGFAELDLNTRTITSTSIGHWMKSRPAEQEDIDPALQKTIRENLFSDYLPTHQVQVDPANAIALEQSDWLDAINTGRPCQVPAERGKRAVEIASRICELATASTWNQRPGEKPGVAGRVHKSKAGQKPESQLDDPARRAA